MDLMMEPLSEADVPEFRRLAQESFQRSFESCFGATDKTVLPDADIDTTLALYGSSAFWAVHEGRRVGGAVVREDPPGRCHLDILFVIPGCQGLGVGAEIFRRLEGMHPDAVSWETLTPYFDRRNIHFYINVCGFKAVEYYNPKHPMPDTSDDFIGDGGLGMLRFVKRCGRHRHTY